MEEEIWPKPISLYSLYIYSGRGITKKADNKQIREDMHFFLYTRKFGEYCEICGEFVYKFKYQMCCSGHECGCMGQPIEPCICSKECWDKLMEGKK